MNVAVRNHSASPRIEIDSYLVTTICDAAVSAPAGKIEFSGAAWDSRLVEPGNLFVALRGDRTDGHLYLRQAVERGAAVVMVERGHEAADPGPGVPCIQVDDTRRGLQALARWYRDRFDIPFVAVTGSNGKTTTKEMIAAALGARYRVFRTRGNLNSGIGVPISLFDLTGDMQVGVCELGMSSRGEIDLLGRIVRPHYAVFTNIAPAHLETLGSIEEVAAAKFELLEHLPADGIAFFCADDPLLRTRAQSLGSRARTYGLAADADVRATDVRTDEHGVRFRLEGGLDVVLPLFGQHNVGNALAALSVARALHVDTLAAVAALAVLPPSPHRSRVLPLERITIIDDVYNANPQATSSALESFARFPSRGRRVAVLGDMLELGEYSSSLHREVGERAAALRLDLLLTVGPQARELAAGARAAGMPPGHIQSFDDAATCAAQSGRWCRDGDVVLLKASRGVALEQVIRALEKEFGKPHKEES